MKKLLLMIVFLSSVSLHPENYRNKLILPAIDYNDLHWNYAYNPIKERKPGIFKETVEKWEYKFSSDWILQRTPTERINSMNALLKHIESSQTFQEVLANNSLYSVENNDLRDVLNGEIYGKQLAKYILLKHEYLIIEHSASLSNLKNVTIEHILPQTPKDGSSWIETFTKAQREEWTNRLANLVLISGKKNSKLSNRDFLEKKEKYMTDEKFKNSLLPSSGIVFDYNEWTINSLEKRQQEMLDILVKQN